MAIGRDLPKVSIVRKKLVFKPRLVQFQSHALSAAQDLVDGSTQSTCWGPIQDLLNRNSRGGTWMSISCRQWSESLWGDQDDGACKRPVSLACWAHLEKLNREFLMILYAWWYPILPSGSCKEGRVWHGNLSKPWGQVHRSLCF